ncbi:hypothetical protein JCM10295v2_001509 [Rhodotorula toruloides]
MDTHHSYIIVFSLRDILGLLKAFVFVDTAIKRGARNPSQRDVRFYSQPTGDILDDSDGPYPPFLHYCTRNLTDAAHLLALILNAINQIWWFEEVMLYEQDAGRATFDAFSGFSKEAQLVVAGIKALAWQIFNPPTSSLGLRLRTIRLRHRPLFSRESNHS